MEQETCGSCIKFADCIISHNIYNEACGNYHSINPACKQCISFDKQRVRCQKDGWGSFSGVIVPLSTSTPVNMKSANPRAKKHYGMNLEDFSRKVCKGEGTMTTAAERFLEELRSNGWSRRDIENAIDTAKYSMPIERGIRSDEFKSTSPTLLSVQRKMQTISDLNYKIANVEKLMLDFTEKLSKYRQQREALQSELASGINVEFADGTKFSGKFDFSKPINQDPEVKL